jgi:hypothetical protein
MNRLRNQQFAFNRVYFFGENSDLWESCKNKQWIISAYLEHFNKILGHLNALEEQDQPIKNIKSFNNHWTPAQNLLQRSSTENSNFRIFYSKDTYGMFLYEIANISIDQCKSAYHMLTEKSPFNPTTPDQHIGLIKTYEFLMQGESEIVSRRKLEAKTFESLRNEFEQTTNETVSEFLTLQKQMDDWSKEVKSGHLNWENTNKNEFEDFLAKKNETLETLEQIYKEKLRLEAPIEYWKRRAEHYKNQGRIWLLVLSGVVSVLIAILLLLLYETPEAFHHNLFKLEPEAIKGIILFASIISFGAYLARVCARMTFSSFHLQRDAEEREQLTYVYLALSEGEQVETEDRHLILQSLFSRADTGLLGDDSAPTMPGVGPILDACGKKSV